MMAREVRIERRGARGLSDAEIQFLAGNIPEPTTEALDAYRRAPALTAAATAEQTLARVEQEAGEAVTSLQQIGEQVEAGAAAAVQAAISEFQADQEQLQALADILVPSGATATFRDSDNLMLLGDML